jgi:uncharacterized protein involved in type VI secretion and phage assembly
LLLLSFKGKETLSRLFAYRAELLNEDAGIDPQALLGQRVGIELGLAEGDSGISTPSSRDSANGAASVS